MTPLVLIRHGPTDWNADRRLQGHTDVPLSEEGRELVSSWRVPPPVDGYRWVSSPLQRASETAELLGARDPALEPRIIEMHFGEWEGRRLPDLRSELGEEMVRNEARGLDFQPEGGETPRQVQERLVPVRHGDRMGSRWTVAREVRVGRHALFPGWKRRTSRCRTDQCRAR
jgi:broad specificity phosphatase PhoE